MNVLNETLVNLLATIISGLIGIALLQLFTYLRSKTSLIQDEQAKQIVDNTIDKVEKLINANIIKTENVSKPIMVQALQDGKIEKAELVKLRDEVRENVLSQLSQDSIDVLNDSLVDVEKYIDTKIESQLAILKEQEGIPVNHTVINQ